MSLENQITEAKLAEQSAIIGMVPDPARRMAVALQNFHDAGITVEVSEAALRDVHDAMLAVLADAEFVIDLVRKLAGPQPGPVPQHLITVMQMGTGYFRHSRDTLRSLFVARNAARRAAKKGNGP